VNYRRVVLLVATGALLVNAAWNLSIMVPHVLNQQFAIGVDHRFFVAQVERWLSGGGFYLPHQLAGPYEFETARDNLYPPLALWLFLPFVRLPAILWWAIPVALIGYSLWRLRPAMWTWPYLAFVLWYPRSQAAFLFGSTSIWVAALVCLAAVHPWAAPLTLFKPSFGPFALFRIRERAWVAGGVAVIAASLAVLPLWPDYVRVTLNGNTSILYSLIDYPIVATGIVLWLGRTRQEPASPASGR
jgi:hypothetical protein